MTSEAKQTLVMFELLYKKIDENSASACAYIFFKLCDLLDTNYQDIEKVANKKRNTEYWTHHDKRFEEIKTHYEKRND